MRRRYLLPGGIFAAIVTVRVNGTPDNTQSLRVEGQDSSNATMMAFGSQNQPSVDSIQEFSGSNQQLCGRIRPGGRRGLHRHHEVRDQLFHGTAYDYFVNESLNASYAVSSTPSRASAETTTASPSAVR